MKVGDYVRTPRGITKIIDIRDEIIRNSANGNEVAINTRRYITDNNFSVSNEYKTSSNIIDLIEVGDYVNGHLVFDKAPGCVYIEDNQNKLAHIPYTKDNIKSIVTKEQFESMEYRIGD